MTDETGLERLRRRGRMAGAVLVGLFGLGFGLTLIGFTVHNAILFLARGPVLMSATIYIVVALLFVMLGGGIAYHAVKFPLRLWRDRHTPLPEIGDTPMVIARKRPRRIWSMLGVGAALATISVVLALKLPDIPSERWPVYLVSGVYLLSILIAFVRSWFPPRLYWEPIVLDAEGIDDRSLGRGRIPWRDVVDLSFGALAAGNGTLLKLAEPPQPLPGVTVLDIGLRPLLDRFVHGRRYLVIRVHGLDLSHERLFRLIQAYWRHGNRGGSVISRIAR